MYRVLIVDDERFIRRSLINRIDWSRYGMEVVGEAGDGRSAFELLPSLKPDVIFADIRMPVMDGLELAALVQEEYSGIYVILVTAYSDFEYARRGIACGVFDYVLKPLKPEALDGTLARLLPLLEKDEQKKREVTAEEAQRMPEGTCFAALAVQAPKRRGEGKPAAAEQLEIRTRRSADAGRLLYIRDGGGEGYSVYILRWEKGREVPEDLRSAVRELRAEAENADRAGDPEKCQSDGRRYIGISELFRWSGEADTFREAVEESLYALKCRLLYRVPDRIYAWKDARELAGKAVVSRDPSPLPEMARRSFEECKFIEGGQLLETYLDQIPWGRIRNPDTVESIVDVCLTELFRAAWIAGGDYGTDLKLYSACVRRNGYLLEFADPDELSEKLREIIRRSTAAMGEQQDDLAVKAARFLQTHYREDIQICTLEREFNVSGSSLMATFKKEKGVTINNYLTTVRMEKAKELLGSAVVSIQDAASMVGYADANYFARAFKNYTGMTPSQFRAGGKAASSRHT